MIDLSAAERLILAIDTSSKVEAERLADLARQAGARFIKLGLELSSATSWSYCSELAAKHKLDWIADAKLHDIPNTVAAATRNIAALSHPPSAITMHASAGQEAMRRAQAEAGNIKILAVTILTSINDNEADQKVIKLARDAASAGLGGVVASPLELAALKSDAKTQNLFVMTPGIRSAGTATNDQARTATPAAATKNGANLLVIGRQVTSSQDPLAAYKAIVDEVSAALATTSDPG
jgi:orotidine-5'-phosphate decarboxylase